jgi:mannosyltransferase OCH1-like enzyme
MISISNDKKRNILKRIQAYAEIKRKMTISHPIKRNYHTVIPLNIFQTWCTKNLPPRMAQATQLIRDTNPAFQYHLFDDADCRNFISQHFSGDILGAYDKLIPGAYKADLWRYCVLYQLGGIYVDIKYVPNRGFKFINLTEQEHWTLDADNYGIYNAVMVCRPRNGILWQAIHQIVQHCRTNYYGNHVLDPTGPGLLSRYFTSEDREKFQLKHQCFFLANRYVLFNNFYILKSYDGYMEEKETNPIPYYAILWMQRRVYH